MRLSKCLYALIEYRKILTCNSLQVLLDASVKKYMAWDTLSLILQVSALSNLEAFKQSARNPLVAR